MNKLFPTLDEGILDLRINYYSSPAEITSWSVKPLRLS